MTTTTKVDGHRGRERGTVPDGVPDLEDLESAAPGRRAPRQQSCAGSCPRCHEAGFAGSPTREQLIEALRTRM